MAVPPEARPRPGIPVDSAAGVLEGPGFSITYDLGRFGEPVDSIPGQRDRRERVVSGRPAVEVAFVPDDEPVPWARVLQVEVDRERTLTVRVSCDPAELCAMADEVFDSIDLG